MKTATSPTVTVPATIGRPAVAVTGLWESLAQSPPPPRAFDPSMVAGLPEPAGRWPTHAITVGVPLHHAVVLEMEGRIRISRWLRFRAVQLHVPPAGYVWTARAGVGPLLISGYDRYADGVGEMHWSLLGRVPVMDATGADIDRSAAGRVALDALFVPTAWLGPAVTWSESGEEKQLSPSGMSAPTRCASRSSSAPTGGLSLQRWRAGATPNGEPWGEYHCGGTVDGEADYGGVKVPIQVRAGWFFGTNRWGQGEFFRASITNAKFV